MEGLVLIFTSLPKCFCTLSGHSIPAQLAGMPSARGFESSQEAVGMSTGAYLLLNAGLGHLWLHTEGTSRAGRSEMSLVWELQHSQ